jgi:phosphatidylglycerol lysyltransferase
MNRPAPTRPTKNPVPPSDPSPEVQAGAVSLLAWLRRAAPPILILVTGVAAWFELRGFDFHAVHESVRRVPLETLAGLHLLALAAISGMSLYDLWVSRWLKVGVPTGRLLRYSWVANTMNNLIGLSGLAGSGVRILLLTREGVSARTASLYSGVVMLSIPVGLSVLVLFTLLLGDARLVPAGLSRWAVRAVLIGDAAYLPIFFALCLSRVIARRVLHSESRLGWGGGLSLMTISTLDWLLAVLVAWVCVTATGSSVAPGIFLAAFALASTLGVLSLIPGGLGVFDGSLVVMLSVTGASAENVVAGLLLYRLAYYLVPWLIGVYLGAALMAKSDPAFVARLAKHWQDNPLLGLLRLPLHFFANLGVRLLGYLTFATGVVMLVSAAVPGLQSRIELLLRVIPLPAMEVSHSLSVGVGVLLIALSRGISQRAKAAYHLTMPLLLAGALLSLLKGADLEEAFFLLAVAGLLRIRRGAFYRLSYPLLGRRSLLWLLATVACVVGYILLGTWVEGESALGSDLWLKVAPNLHVARFLRSLPLAALALLGWLAWGYFRMPRPELQRLDATTLLKTRDWLSSNPGGSFAHLAFMGDKHLFYAAGGRCLIQFARIRNRLVALGDPMGAPDLFGQAILEFRAFADRHDLDPVFYEVADEHLHRYHDAGFSLFKVGEMGLVRTETFSLAGRRSQALRAAVGRAQREGLGAELLEHPVSEATWSELRAVSDAWLAARGSKEKRFSLGAFDRVYLTWSPLFVARQNGRIVAFASMTPSYDGRTEIGVDLVRQLPDVPTETMDYLFTRMIEHAVAEGYTWFNLGMAPMSGVGKTRYARPDERVARYAYDYGNRLYNYKGLRSFKEKFHPEWRSRYIAYPLSAPLPVVLVDIAALIAGGYRRILTRP